jgi:superoxide dismutase, Cu-Zn family
MQSTKLIGLSLIAAIFMVGCATTLKGPDGIAQLSARSGSNVSGTVNVSEVPGGVKVQAKVRGLTPGEHGFHIHEVGDCSAPEAISAKGHFNPSGKEHGLFSSPEHHGGDMPNLIANAQGEATYSFELMGVSLAGTGGVIGRSLVIHADPDDYKSQPAGNSGKRIACGVISSQ